MAGRLRLRTRPGFAANTEGSSRRALKRAWEASFAADLVLVVLDRSEPLTSEDRAVIEAHPQALRVANKADLAEAWSETALSALAVSAELGTGLEALMHTISDRLVPDPPAIGNSGSVPG